MSTLLPALLLWFAPVEPGEMETLVKRLIGVFTAAEAEAADPVSAEQALLQGAIPGMLRRLDPHTIFFDASQFEQLKELEKSTRKGFGSVVSVLPGRVIFLQTLPGTPSARSGISGGDEIVAINNIPLARLDMEQIIGLLQQSRQQQARLDVRRPGNARLLTFLLTPEDVQSPAVDRAFLIKPGTGYLRIANFETETGAQMQKAIESMGGDKLEALVIDLRNNPGGVLSAALDVCSLILKPGTKILTVRGRSKETEEVRVADTAKPYSFRVSVLLNAKSASAAEIVAGAVQDHDRGPVLGEPSFGKGLVQSVYPLSSGTGIALTTAYYYTPSGRSIQKPLEGAQIDGKAGDAQTREYRTDKGRLVRGGGGIQPDEIVLPEATTRFRAVMDATGILTLYATQYLQKNKVDERFEVTNSLLDDLQVYLSQTKIRPGLAEWSTERDWISFRLKQEIFNQALGVARGDEVEMRRDPVVVRALESMSGSGN